MKKLGFTYRMCLEFDTPVCNHYFALRCIPSSNEVQKIQLSNRYVYPANCLSEVTDGFGNHKFVGQCFNAHDKFEYEVAGTAIVEGMKVQHEKLHPMYKYSSVYTRPTDNIQKYLRELSLPEDTMLRKSVYLMNSLYERFRYVPGSTDIHTTAGEAFDKNKGVCQDYAHIFITLCRQSGIPSRYVNGLMIGEGYTHAWVEVYTGDGWYGLDPTNNLHVDDYYIKLAHGRDYADCVLDKGIFWGNANQTQEIYVNVEEL